MTRLKRWSPYASQVAYQTGAYHGFCSMKQLGAFLIPPGWDTSPSQGYPQHYIQWCPCAQEPALFKTLISWIINYILYCNNINLNKTKTVIPGGPWNRTPLGGEILNFSNTSGYISGNKTISFRARICLLRPPTASNITWPETKTFKIKF